MGHANLKPFATGSDVEKPCKEAVENDFASVYVNPRNVSLAKELLKGSDVMTCTVIGFPLGQNTTEIKVRAVDTTGAGDAFNGGFATAVAEGTLPGQALRFANCTGTLSVTKTGTYPAIPYREDILAMMKKEYGADV